MEFNCWYLNSCNNSGKGKCESCLWNKRMLYFIDHSGLPIKRAFNDKLKDVDNPDFRKFIEIEKNIASFVHDGKNIILKVNDKTNEAIEYGIKFLLNYFNAVADTEYDIKGLFVDMSLYADRLRDNLTLPDTDLIELKRNINKVDLVVFYNYGIMTDYVNSIVQSNLETRQNNKLSSLIILGEKITQNSENILSKFTAEKIII